MEHRVNAQVAEPDELTDAEFSEVGRECSKYSRLSVWITIVGFLSAFWIFVYFYALPWTWRYVSRLIGL